MKVEMKILKPVTLINMLKMPLLLLFLYSPASVSALSNISAEDTALVREEALHVYIDYSESDNTERYLRSEIPFVSYVRDPHLAQIHILITHQRTGSGGQKLYVSFIGKDIFSGQDQTLFFISPQSDTDDQRREGLARIVKMGLMPYISQTSIADQIEIRYDDVKLKDAKEMLYDTWDFWVFYIELGGGFNAEESRDAYNITSALSADRVTDMWKISNRFKYLYEEENFNDDEESLTSSFRQWELSSAIVRSLSIKWSAGFAAEISSTTYRNIKLGLSFAPAIEYNFFPWPEAEKRIFTLAYHAGFRSMQYFEETLYDKMENNLWYHSLVLELQMTQTWGNVDIEIEASQYLKLRDQYSIKLDVEFAYRISSGWEFVLESELESIHDQIYLPKGDASIDEILLKRRQLATTYDVRLTLGFRYTFGSIYNNIINRRF
jgi:hypothetical protein